MNVAERLSRDVRALGAAAPVRAGYEASKRFGGHKLLFGRLARMSASEPPMADLSAFRFVDPNGVPAEAVSRTVDAADQLLSGEVTLFGVPVPFSPDGPTQVLVERPGCWPDQPWWEIDLRSDARPADVKWAWELGRHRHVVTLARATAVSDDGRYGAALEATLWHWMAQNPPEQGVHWYSNLELAIRALAWCEVLALAGTELSDGTRTEMLRHLAHSGRHLVADLPYTLSTMRNNHLLGDGLGLIALGRLFPSKNHSWGRIGRWLFSTQLRRHMRPDGSMIEDSLSYHRFVLDMLIMRVLLGGPDAEGSHQAMEAAAQHLARLGALKGPVPQYGDWDEGRVLAAAPGVESIAGTVRLALAVAGAGAEVGWRERHDECAWYAEAGVPLVAQATVDDGEAVGGGFSRAAVGDLQVWFKWGGGTSHQHADLSSVSLCDGEQWVVGDPGTGTYNGPIEVRNYFRSSVAHSVLRVEGLDQLEPHRAFRWTHGAEGLPGKNLHLGDAVVMWGVHNAYKRLDPQRRVVRAVAVTPLGMGVADWVEGHPTDASISVPLGPGVYPEGTSAVLTADSRSWHLGASMPLGEAETGPLAGGSGWWSNTYGQWAPAVRLEGSTTTAEPVAWCLATAPGQVPRRLDGRIEMLGVALKVSWDDAAAELTTEVGDQAVTQRLDLP